MTDPVIDAAQRVMTGPPRTLYVDDLIAAAREALKPIQEKCEKWADSWESPPVWDLPDGNTQNAIRLLLADLAPLIYREDEL